MKSIYTVSIQFLIYSSYALVEWMSQRDGIYAKILLLLVFVYLSFFVANTNGFTVRKAVKITVTTCIIYFSMQKAFWWLLDF